MSENNNHYHEDNVINLNDDIINLFLNYVDDMYEEKIKGIHQEIEVYGFIICITALTFLFTGLLSFFVWVFFFLELDTSIEQDELIEKFYLDSENISMDIFASDAKFCNSATDNKLLLDNYKLKWNLSKKIKEKAVFWESNISDNEADYSGYDSLLAVYEHGSSETSQYTETDKPLLN